MSFGDSFLHPAAAKYAERLIDVPFPVMRRIEEQVRAEEQPAVGRAVGAALRTLAASSGGRRALEVGCNLGYSALWIASGMSAHGRLDTIEIDADLAQRARDHFEAAGLGARIQVHEGAALDVMPQLEAGAYDFVFLDAVKSEYPEYLRLAKRLLRPGGIIAADNMYWMGAAWNPNDKEEDTEGVRAYARRIFTDGRFLSMIVPVEDGLAVTVVRPPP